MSWFEAILIIILICIIAYLYYKEGFDAGYTEGFIDGTIEEHNKNDYESIKNFIEPDSLLH